MSTYSTGLVCLLVLTSTICMKIATGDSNSSTTDVNETTSQTVTTPNDTLTTSEISESTTTEPSNVTPNSETPSSTLTQKSSQTSPNTVTISGTSPTASPSSSTTANISTVSAVSMSTENTTSDNTTVNSITTQTPNETTAAGSSGAVLTTTTTLTPTTSAAVTSTPAPTGLNPDGLFTLLFKVDDNDTVSCRSNCSYTSIQQNVVESFINLAGFIGVREKKESRRRRNTAFSVEVLFESKTLIGMTEVQVYNQTVEGFQQLSNKSSLNVDLAKVENLATAFATQCKNICSAINPCKDGYTCTEKACTSSNKCSDSTCNGRGTCLLNKETLVPYCVCDSNNDYEYSGDKCEKEEISKAKVIQIVSGVLGAFCALFLLIIIIICCRRGSSKSSHL